MTLAEFKKRQKEYLRSFKKLAKDDPDEAARIAQARLHSAGIIDRFGNLAKPYR